jgi:TetR/AcrR family transcriptional regulator, mexJK operon transcriptional repressor
MPQPARQGRPPKDEAHLVDNQILEAARREFLSVGYAEATIDAIAARAQASKRTIYARHATKAALFEAVVLAYLEQQLVPLEEIVIADLGLRDKMLRLGEALVHAACDPHSIAMDRAVFAAAMAFPQLAARLHQAGFERVTLLLTRVLADAGAKRPKTASESFYSLLVLNPLRLGMLGKKPPRPNVFEVTKFVLAGCELRRE